MYLTRGQCPTELFPPNLGLSRCKVTTKAQVLKTHAQIIQMEELIAFFDTTLRTLLASPKESRSLLPSNSVAEPSSDLQNHEKQLSAALMRVNHVGEICAQALYAAQSLATKDPQLKEEFHLAAKDEFDHLAWTKNRLDELQSHASLLNPVWFAGAFGLGYAVGKLGGDKLSLGFLEETEKQVSEHLRSHLDRLPTKDSASREIVYQMIKDEEGHAKKARELGAEELPFPLKIAMKLSAKVMTTVAHYI